jgi:hypothetical protein
MNNPFRDAIIKINGETPREARNLAARCCDIAEHVVKAQGIEACIVIGINEGTADIGGAGVMFLGDPNQKTHEILADIVVSFLKRGGKIQGFSIPEGTQ